MTMQGMSFIISYAILHAMILLPHDGLCFMTVRHLRPLYFREETKQYQSSFIQPYTTTATTALSLSSSSSSSSSNDDESPPSLSSLSKNSRSSSNLQDFLTDDLCEEIAKHIKDQVTIPFIPDGIITFVFTQVIENLVTECLSDDSLVKVKELLVSATTMSQYDNLNFDEIHSLTNQVAFELNGKINVPMLNEQQEEIVLQQIIKVLFQFLTEQASNPYPKVVVMYEEIDTTNVLFELSSSTNTAIISRKILVDAMNKVIDIPILRESEEQILLDQIISRCTNQMKDLVPPKLIEIMRSETANGLDDIKLYLIQLLQERIDLPSSLLTEQQEYELIVAIVTIIIDTYVDHTEIGFLLLTNEEQLKKLQERKSTLELKLEFNKKRYDREQQNIQLQIDRVNNRMIEKITNH